MPAIIHIPYKNLNILEASDAPLDYGQSWFQAPTCVEVFDIECHVNLFRYYFFRILVSFYIKYPQNFMATPLFENNTSLDGQAGH